VSSVRRHIVEVVTPKHGARKGTTVSEQTSSGETFDRGVPGAESAEELYGDGSVPQDADFTDPDDLDDPVGDSILNDLPEGGARDGELPEGTAGP